jgi:hypothetical protein
MATLKVVSKWHVISIFHCMSGDTRKNSLKQQHISRSLITSPVPELDFQAFLQTTSYPQTRPALFQPPHSLWPVAANLQDAGSGGGDEHAEWGQTDRKESADLEYHSSENSGRYHQIMSGSKGHAEDVARPNGRYCLDKRRSCNSTRNRGRTSCCEEHDRIE